MIDEINNKTTATVFSSFLSIANEEYEALTNYCNSLSLLTHAIHNNTASTPTISTSISATNDNNNNNESSEVMDPNLFLPKQLLSSSSSSSSSSSLFLQKEKQSNALKEYQNSLNELQNIHSKLLTCHDTIVNVMNDDVKEHQLQQSSQSIHLLSSTSTLVLLVKSISNHLELSTRVLKTCASSMKNGYGPFYENGLLKNLGGGGGDITSGTSSSMEDWHEIRIVALTAYRGSIVRLKQMVDGSKE